MGQELKYKENVFSIIPKGYRKSGQLSDWINSFLMKTQSHHNKLNKGTANQLVLTQSSTLETYSFSLKGSQSNQLRLRIHRVDRHI